MDGPQPVSFAIAGLDLRLECDGDPAFDTIRAFVAEQVRHLVPNDGRLTSGSAAINELRLIPRWAEVREPFAPCPSVTHRPVSAVMRA